MTDNGGLQNIPPRRALAANGAKPRVRARQGKFFVTGDSFNNFLTRTGINAGNLSSGGTYGFNPITRIRLRLEWAYRGSWVCGTVVDCIAEDMTREGVDLVADTKPGQIQDLEHDAIESTGTWPALLDCVKWARLYGGGGGLIMIDGHDVSTPFDPRDVGRDQYKGILPLDRWSLFPSLDKLVQAWGPDIGKPEFYDLRPDYGTGLKEMRIHHSRLIRLEGVKLPYWQAITENLWGMSVIERLWDRLIAFDSTTQGAAQLVYKAHLRTMKVDQLRKIIATGGDMLDGLAKQMDMIRAYQSSEGLTLIDSKDDFQVDQYTFTGLDEVLLQFGQQLSGASQIPLVRLFGQSPAGLNSTGESDLRTYYDNVRRRQVNDLGLGVLKVYHCAYRSRFGTDPKGQFRLDWKPLWLLKESEKAEIAGKMTETALSAYEKGVSGRAMTLKELKQGAKITGAWSNITDEDIKKAEADDKAEAEVPSPEELGLVEGAVPKAGKPGQLRVVQGGEGQ